VTCEESLASSLRGPSLVSGQQVSLLPGSAPTSQLAPLGPRPPPMNGDDSLALQNGQAG
jgi:hypothetical protein